MDPAVLSEEVFGLQKDRTQAASQTVLGSRKLVLQECSGMGLFTYFI